ncbi:hypothetical protein D3C75_1223650 [compost metagenome]
MRPGTDYDIASCIFRTVNTTSLEAAGETNATSIVEDISNIVAEGLTIFDSNNAVGGDTEELIDKNLGSKDSVNEQ